MSSPQEACSTVQEKTCGKENPNLQKRVRFNYRSEELKICREILSNASLTVITIYKFGNSAQVHMQQAKNA
jgi:hypothetical protein